MINIFRLLSCLDQWFPISYSGVRNKVTFLTRRSEKQLILVPLPWSCIGIGKLVRLGCNYFVVEHNSAQ